MKVFIFLMCFLSTPLLAENLIVGDSVFALTKAVPRYLSRHDVDFEMRAKVGAKIEEIAVFYKRHVTLVGVPETVIMNGGGNNVIRGNIKNCVRQSSKCDLVLENTLNAIYSLWQQMHNDGVKKIIYVGVHYLDKPFKNLNPIVDKAMDSINIYHKKMNVRFVDTRRTFEKPGLLLFDGIHPNQAGSEEIAKLILNQL